MPISELNLKVDFRDITGTMKPMHGIGQPPVTSLSNFFFPYLKRAGIPYSRLHDVGGMMGGNLYVDIPNIFRDFSAIYQSICVHFLYINTRFETCQPKTV
jgi:hypothetical protein